MLGDLNVPEGLEFLNETLHKLDRRWKVAGITLAKLWFGCQLIVDLGEYLKLLETT